MTDKPRGDFLVETNKEGSKMGNGNLYQAVMDPKDVYYLRVRDKVLVDRPFPETPQTPVKVGRKK